jgi:hypothetical protein
MIRASTMHTSSTYRQYQACFTMLQLHYGLRLGMEIHAEYILR